MRSVAAANRLTVEWARSLQIHGSTIYSAAGVWPLIALLAYSAEGPARDELQSAAGIDGRDGLDMALELISSFGGDLRLALRIWTHAHLPLETTWTQGVPMDLRGQLTGDASRDRIAINHWASQNTDGLIDELDIHLNEAADWKPGTLMVGASAVAVDTKWAAPFGDASLRPTSGPWAGRRLQALRRSTPDQDDVAVAVNSAVGPLTLLTIRGTAEVDVCLAIAEAEHQPSAVLTAACDAIANGVASVRGSALPDDVLYPGLEVTRTYSDALHPSLFVVMPRFTVETRHDLLTTPDVFGLSAAMDRSRGHFPRISSFPLAITNAFQQVKASFSKEGFRAAAVSYVELRFGYQPPHEARCINIVLDRPFAFVAMHRPTGMIAFVGWVEEVDEYDGPLFV